MNMAIIMGNLTRDPEIRSTQDGKPIAKYTVAINYGQNTEADFIPCVAFDRAAEFAEKYLRKGMRVLVSGRIKTGSYTNREGQNVRTTEIYVSSQEFAQNKGDTATPAPAPKTGDGFLPADDVNDAGLPWSTK